ncbi:MAG TPA: hypothetical protein VFY05_09805 [Candidatus Angelobacter sp.]|nr:hypothetical protein [Candidatus Angelobacter sp.]
MQEITTERLQIAYKGRALQQGRMPMLSLAAGLRGQALLIERAKDILYGESVNVRVEVDSEFEASSLIVPVRILADIKFAEQLLIGPAVTACVNLLEILGFAGGSVLTIYKLFKRLRGRRIERAEDIPKEWEIRLTVELLIKLYNDAEIQSQLRRTLDPLHQEGIEEFQTRRQGIAIDSVSKMDLAAADEAEIQDLTKDEEVELDIEKSAWRRDLAWHFNDGRSSFDARIQDDKFWRRIDGGEAFAEGDRLRVHLRTIAHRTAQGKLKVERLIPAVIEVNHVRKQQGQIFGDEFAG